MRQPDIRNGKGFVEARNRFKRQLDRTDRGRPDHDRAGRREIMSIQESVIERWRVRIAPTHSVDRPSSRERNWRPRAGTPSQVGELVMHVDYLKKVASLGSAAEKRRYIDNHRQDWDQFPKLPSSGPTSRSVQKSDLVEIT